MSNAKVVAARRVVASPRFKAHNRGLTVQIMNAIVHQMNDSSAVVPLFRSDTQFRILGELFTNPGLEVTVGDLASRVGVARPTVSHEVARLTSSGLVHSRREGNRTLVRANLNTTVSPDVRSLLAKTYGPQAIIRDALAQISGVDKAFLFGSWAARWHGEPGPVPNDIDLMVIGEVAHDDVWTTAANLSSQLGIAVNPVIRSSEEWADDPTGFADSVRERPQVDVTSQAAARTDREPPRTATEHSR